MGNDSVLVTGATGFIAQHCLLQLIEQGYRVRGTARGAGRTAEVAAVLAPHLPDPARARLEGDLEVVAANLTSDEGWAEAVAGCRYVLHIASPFPDTPPKDERELIDPAREGALRVLKAAVAAGVERVVLTSSVAAIAYGRDRSHVFTEADWSDVDGRGIGAYEKSKTLAERAAWEYMDTQPDTATTLAVINPGLVLGPLLTAQWSTSGEMIKKLLDRELPAVPDINFSVVDVRDVAAAHLAAMTVPAAAGQRFICAIGNRSMRELADVLARYLGPRGFKVPTAKLPGVVLRVFALWDQTSRLALNDLGVRTDVDSTRIREVLGWQPHSFEEMVEAMADTMIEYGVVKS
jgi:nucleoside-diphosphate-sugar epimerase